jgi:hypothetical protein
VWRSQGVRGGDAGAASGETVAECGGVGVIDMVIMVMLVGGFYGH